MTEPTTAQLHDMQRLLDALEGKRRLIASLEQAIEVATKQQQDRQRDLDDRINLRAAPSRLAGLIAYRRSASADLQRRIDLAYGYLLQAILEPDYPGAKPLRVDFYRLSKEARPYLVSAYLDLRVGGVLPSLCLDRSDPEAGTLTYLVTGGPADPAPWRSALPQISAWLGDTYVLAGTTANTVTLQRRPPLPAKLDFNPNMLRPGALMTGLDVDSRQPAVIPFAALTSGTFIPGASGSGKSNALHVLLRSIFANLDLFTAVYLVDGKDGVAFNRYRNLAPDKVTVLWDEPDLWTLTTELVALMRQRNAEQRDAGIDNATSGFIAVVIDEMSTYTARPSSDSKHPDNKRHAQFLDELAMLARRGRSTGLRMLISAQEPTQEQIPTTVRANCLTTLAFRLPIDTHATTLFGQLDGLPVDPRRLLQGHALLKNGLTGELRHVKFPLITATGQPP